MLKTVTVSELRAELAKYLRGLDEGPVTVLSHGKPVAILVEPEMHYALLDKCDMLDDLLKALRPIARTIEERSDTGDIKAV
jgi:prevent-host-death family protein